TYEKRSFVGKRNLHQILSYRRGQCPAIPKERKDEPDTHELHGFTGCCEPEPCQCSFCSPGGCSGRERRRPVPHLAAPAQGSYASSWARRADAARQPREPGRRRPGDLQALLEVVMTSEEGSR